VKAWGNHGFGVLEALALVAFTSILAVTMTRIDEAGKAAMQIDQTRLDFLLWERTVRTSLETGLCDPIFQGQRFAQGRLRPGLPALQAVAPLPTNLAISKAKMTIKTRSLVGGTATFKALLTTLPSFKGAKKSMVFEENIGFTLVNGRVTQCRSQSTSLMMTVPSATLQTFQPAITSCAALGTDGYWVMASGCHRYCSGGLDYNTGVPTECDSGTENVACTCLP
jgi:hypothetical protein